MIDMHCNHTAAMLALQQMTDELFNQGKEQMQNMRQCYRAPLQTNSEAVSQMNNTVRWNINETEIICSKLDFIIEHMKAEVMPERGVLSPCPQDGRAVDL